MSPARTTTAANSYVIGFRCGPTAGHSECSIYHPQGCEEIPFRSIILYHIYQRWGRFRLCVETGVAARLYWYFGSCLGI